MKYYLLQKIQWRHNKTSPLINLRILRMTKSMVLTVLRGLNQISRQQEKQLNLTKKEFQEANHRNQMIQKKNLN